MRQLTLWAYALMFWLSKSKRPAVAAFAHGKAGRLWAVLFQCQSEAAGRFTWQPQTDRQTWLVSRARETGGVTKRRVSP